MIDNPYPFLRSILISTKPSSSREPPEESPALLGAGGRWPVIDEIVDPRVVRQQSNLSCGPASAEILLKDRGITNIEQATIENLTGAPTSAEEIANALNELTPATSHRWQAGFIDTSTPLAAFNLLLNTEQSWMAQRSEFGNRVGHMVVVDGLDLTGFVLIRDPWEGTRYKMNIDEFLKVWNQIAVF